VSHAVRTLLEADLRFAWELNQSEDPHVAAEKWDYFQHLFRQSASAPLVTVDGAPAGFLFGMTREADYDSPNFLWFRAKYPAFLYVDRLAVSAAYRKKGLGAALYAAAEADAQRLGLPVVCCEVNLQPPNPVSLAFHQRIGFEQVGEQTAEGKLVAMLARPVPPKA
jgi:predicted GNAT superfamily acetyltransferase